MKSFSVSEFKVQFSKLLKEVRQGETIEIVSDDERKPIARFEPIDGSMKKQKTKAWSSGRQGKNALANDFR